jgi:hypothetical protein
MLSISERTLRTAKAVRDRACPEVAQAVRQGKLPCLSPPKRRGCHAENHYPVSSDEIIASRPRFCGLFLIPFDTILMNAQKTRRSLMMASVRGRAGIAAKILRVGNHRESPGSDFASRTGVPTIALIDQSKFESFSDSLRYHQERSSATLAPRGTAAHERVPEHFSRTFQAPAGSVRQNQMVATCVLPNPIRSRR